MVIGTPRNYQSSSNEKRFPDQPEKWIPHGQPYEYNLRPEQDAHQIHLTPLDFSIAQTRIYKWTTAEVERFQDENWISQNCVKEDGVLLRKGRMKESHEIELAGGAEKYIVNAGELLSLIHI